MAAEASVLIPSAGAGTELAGLVAELLGQGAREVIVADNGLPEESSAAAAAAGANLVRMGRNAGFAAAVNAAARAARSQILIVTNDDVDPQPGFVADLTAAIGGGAQMAAGVLISAADPGTIESAGVVMDSLLVGHDHLQGYPLDALDHDPPAPLGPCGGAAAFERNAFAALGGFDEGFFAYYEDLDLAIRMRAAGAGCALVGTARATHATSATLGYGSLEKAVVVGRSRGRILRKYGLLRRPLRGAGALLVEAGVSGGLALRHRSLAPARARAAGWLATKPAEQLPPRRWATVSPFGGLRSRLGRARR